MKKKLEEKKKKLREQAVKKKLLTRRLTKARQQKRERELTAIAESVTPKLKPIRNQERVKEQIEKNFEALKALEEEYHNEQKIRMNNNEKLKGMDGLSLEEKVKYLKDLQELKPFDEMDPII